MIVPLFAPPPTIDATNVTSFARGIAEFLARYRGVVIDCSEVVWIASSGMRVLESASRGAQITLVNPRPAVRLMATAFGVVVRLRGGRPSSRAVEPSLPRRRLASVDPGGKLAS